MATKRTPKSNRTATEAEEGARARPGTYEDVDYRLDHFVLDPENRTIPNIDIAKSATSAKLTMTIEGANTLEIGIEDPDLALLRSNFLYGWAWGEDPATGEDGWLIDGRVIDADLDDLAFRLVKVNKTGTSITLTFEDRDVARLREIRGPIKAYRDQMTRAEFVAYLARKLKDPTLDQTIPELHDPQPIETSKQAPTTTERKETAEKGISQGSGLSPSSKLTVKGQRATAAQVKNAETGLDVCERLNAPYRARVALIEAFIAENNMNSGSGGDALNPQLDSVGILQVTNQHGESREQRLDVAHVSAHFLQSGYWIHGGAIAMARKNPDMPAHMIAQNCQGSAFSDGSNYAANRDEAVDFVKAYDGSGAGASTRKTTTRTVEKRYAFQVNANENVWDAMGRLADEVAWRRFMRKGSLWYVSEPYVFAQLADLTIQEGKAAVDTIDFDIDQFARDYIAECNITARSARWTALPGMPVEVDDHGPATGRWLVSQVEKDLLDDTGTVTITIRKPLPDKPEPAPETETTTAGGKESLGSSHGDSPSSKAMALYEACKAISNVTPGYSYGGGHGPIKSVRASQKLDCSSSTSLALYKAGLWDSDKNTRTSGEFSSWGHGGPGKFFTVWYHGGHVYIELNVPGTNGKRFDTGGPGGGSGPKLRNEGRGHSGFSARHWPGL